MLTWPRNWWGALAKLISGVSAVLGVLWAVGLTIGKAVDWWSQKPELVVKTKMLSWTGDDKVITKGDLSGAFREATSLHLGDAKFLVKSDLDSAFKQLHLLVKSDLTSAVITLQSAVKQLQVTQLVTLCVSLVGAWYISRK